MRNILMLALAGLVLAGCAPARYPARYPARNPAIDYDANSRKAFVAHGHPGQDRLFLKVDRGVVSGTVDALIATASGDELVCCSTDKTVRVFDAKTGGEKRKFLWNITGESGACESLALSHDEAFLVLGVDKGLLIYDFRSGALKEEIPVGDRVRAIAISSDDKYLAFAQKGRITLWDLAAKKPVRTIPTASRTVAELVLLKLGGAYVVLDVSLDEYIHISDPDPLRDKHLASLTSHDYSLMGGDSEIYGSDFRYAFEMADIAYNAKKQELAVASRGNNVVWVFGLAPSRAADKILTYKTVIRTRTLKIGELTYSRDGRFLSVDSWDDAQCAEVYETDTHTLIAGLGLNQARPMWPTAFVDATTLVGIGHEDGAFHYWDFTKPGASGLRKEGGEVSVSPKRSVSFDGNYLAWGRRCCKYDGFFGDGFDENCLALESALDLNTLKTVHGLRSGDFSRVGVENDRYRLELGPTNPINPDLIFRLKDKASGRTVLFVDVLPEDGWVPHAYGLTDDLIISGNRSGRLVAYDFHGNKVIDFVGHSSCVRSLSISGSTLVSSDLSGEILLWKIPTAAERAASCVTKTHPLFTFLIDDEERCLVVAGDGYFAGAYALLPKVWLHVNGDRGSRGARWLGLNQLYDHFYRPDIVRARLQRLDAMEGLGSAPMDEAIACPPPEITRLSLNETAPGEVEIAYTVKDTGGGIGRIRFYINGKLFHVADGRGAMSGVGGASLSPVFAANTVPQRLRGLRRVALPASRPTKPGWVSRVGAERAGVLSVKTAGGQNTLRVAAFNGKNTVQGLMKEAVFFSTASPKQPKVHALVVGIDAYRNGSLNLSNAVDDAEEVKKIVRRHLGRVYGSYEVVSLFDGEATKGKILGKLSEIKAAANPEDVFLLFVASHGEVADEFYLIAHDYARDDGAFDDRSWLSASRLMAALEEIPAQKQVVILDTCHSGALNDIMGGFYDARMSTFTHTAGVTLFASTRASQQSVDDYRGNGLLVHLLKRAFRAKPDTDHSKRIGIYEIGDELQRQFNNIDARVQSIQQPRVSKFGTDFAVDKL